MFKREAFAIVQERLRQFDSVALLGPRQVGKTTLAHQTAERWSTGAGAEIDLVLELAPGQRWAIEIKMSSAPSVDKGFYIAADDLGADRRILVYRGNENFPMRHGVEAMSLLQAMNEISAAGQTSGRKTGCS